MKKIKVSIVIPVYNVSAYVERCIKSVLYQTYTCIECIIVDDATPDDSIFKCKQLIEGYQGPIRFDILHHEHNRGLSASRNTGTKAATGEYVFYLDSDDEILPNSIEKMVEVVHDYPDVEMVQGNYETYIQDDNSNPTLKERTHLLEGNYDSKEEIQNIYKKDGVFNSHAWNKLLKKDFLFQNQLFFKEGVLWEDMLWFCLVKRCLSRYSVVADITLKYYIRPNSITTGTSDKERARHLEKIYEGIALNFSERDQGWEAKKNLRGFCSVLIHNYNSQTSQQTAQLFLKALDDSPYLLSRLYLRFTIFLSKSSAGRNFFALARSIRKAIKSKIE